MSKAPDDSWAVLIEGDESEDVPLWMALALFRSEDLDDGLKENSSFINEIKPIHVRRRRAAYVISLIFGFCTIVSLFALAAFGASEEANLLFIVSLGSIALTAAPQMWRQVFQYGWLTPEVPLVLPHASDHYFDVFLGYLQRAAEPYAYYRSWFGRKRKPLDRHHFFGRLRYFSFCEHSATRGLVMRSRAGLALPSDIFIHRSDLEKMIALSKPKRKGGSGRNVKYAYFEAIFDLRADPRLALLDLSDEDAAIRSMTDWLTQWFDSAANASGMLPDRDQLMPYAKKIYAHLIRQAASKAS